MTARGFTLIEVVVATAVVATAGLALQSLIVRSLGTIDRDVRRAETLGVARSLLAESLLGPPATGSASGTLPNGLRFTRTVIPTRHPALHEVRIHVERTDHADASDLVELRYAPQR